MVSRSKKPAPTKEHRWRIFRIRGTPAIILGHVYAPDQKSALAKAIEEFRVPPALQDRLMARRDG